MQRVHCSQARVLRAVLTGVVALLVISCGEPVAPAPPSAQPLTKTNAEPPADSREAVAVAVRDAQTRILPSVAAPEATAQLLAALDELAAALVRRESALGPPIRQADRALDALKDALKADADPAADLTAVGLVLDRASDLKQ